MLQLLSHLAVTRKSLREEKRIEIELPPSLAIEHMGDGQRIQTNDVDGSSEYNMDIVYVCVCAENNLIYSMVNKAPCPQCLLLLLTEEEREQYFGSIAVFNLLIVLISFYLETEIILDNLDGISI